MRTFYVFRSGATSDGVYVRTNNYDKVTAFCAIEGYDHTFPLTEAAARHVDYSGFWQPLLICLDEEEE